MQITEFPPSPELATVIYSYYFIVKNHNDQEHIPPLGTPVLQFHLQNDLNRYFQNYPVELSPVMLVGQLTRYAKLETRGAVEMIGVNFHETAIFRLSDFPLHSIIDSATPGRHIFGSKVENLFESLKSITDPDIRIARLNEFFCNVFRGKETDHDRFDRLIAEIRKRNGNITISQVCDLYAASERTVERLFYKRVGISPKKYCIVIRHLHLMRLLHDKKTVTLAEILDECGYIDIPHFYKEFKKVSGVTPSAFFQADQRFAKNLLQL